MEAGDGARPRGRLRRRKPYARYSAELAVRLCERLAAGELLYRIAREPGMPTPEAVAKWAKAKPDFAAALDEARRAGGRPAGKRGPVFTYCEATADAIFERLCDGESLTAIGRDPTMPSISTIFYWRRRFPEFEDAVQLGKEIQAERFCDRACELMDAATPETAYLTHVLLNHLRWAAGMMAPRAYRLKMAEPPKPQESRTMLFRHFAIEADEATGEMKVVAYCPNPFTGQAEREDAPGWRPPGDETVIPMPGGRCGR